MARCGVALPFTDPPICPASPAMILLILRLSVAACLRAGGGGWEDEGGQEQQTKGMIVNTIISTISHLSSIFDSHVQ